MPVVLSPSPQEHYQEWTELISHRTLTCLGCAALWISWDPVTLLHCTPPEEVMFVGFSLQYLLLCKILPFDGSCSMFFFFLLAQRSCSSRGSQPHAASCSSNCWEPEPDAPGSRSQGKQCRTLHCSAMPQTLSVLCKYAQHFT